MLLTRFHAGLGGGDVGSVDQDLCTSSRAEKCIQILNSLHFLRYTSLGTETTSKTMDIREVNNRQVCVASFVTYCPVAIWLRHFVYAIENMWSILEETRRTRPISQQQHHERLSQLILYINGAPWTGFHALRCQMPLFLCRCVRPVPRWYVMAQVYQISAYSARLARCWTAHLTSPFLGWSQITWCWTTVCFILGRLIRLSATFNGSVITVSVRVRRTNPECEYLAENLVRPKRWRMPKLLCMGTHT